MGVREQVNDRKSLVAGAAVVLILVAGYVIFTQVRQTMGTAGPGDAYFTNDDGKTFFYDDAQKLTPFDKDGKPAVRAHVFECGGERVVGYMSRMTERAKAAYEEANKYKGTGKPPPNAMELAMIGQTGTEVKKPGGDKWVPQSNPASTAIRAFQCPDGSAPTEVTP
jgi:hypothetical protein